jgi:peptidoglycan/xylan/chitin deacetylase (PgdA/CDA1 family)
MGLPDTTRSDRRQPTAVKRLLITFDAEEVDWGPAPTAARDSTGPSAEGIDRILAVLDRVSVRSTFFCTALFAQRQPLRLRAIADGGHEVASHGWEHGDDYERLPPALALGRLRDSRHLLEDVTGREILGVRAPRLAACPAGVLAGAGFAYDASLQPAWARAGLRGLGMSRQPRMEEGVVRVPLSVVPIIGLPVAWYVFRVAGPHATYNLARLSGVGIPFVHLYFHPWEAATLARDLARHPLGWRCGPAWLDRFETMASRLALSHDPATVGEFVTAWKSG